MVAHAAEARDRGDPGARQRGHVDAVAGVVLEVVEVHQRRLGHVVEGEVEVADLGGDHRLRARRQRRVAHGQRLVVGEVARLLLGGEGIAAQIQRQHQVGLLDHLLAVEVEVGVVQEEGIGVGRRVRRSPTARGGCSPPTAGGRRAPRRREPSSPRRRRARRRPPRVSTPSVRAMSGKSLARGRRRRSGSSARRGSCRRCCRRPR